MAELQVEGEQVVLHLSRVEEFEAVHGDLRAPLSAVRAVEVLDDAHEPVDRPSTGASRSSFDRIHASP